MPGIFLKNTLTKKEDIWKELTSFKRLFGYFWLLLKLQLSRVMYNTFATCCRSIADNTENNVSGRMALTVPETRQIHASFDVLLESIHAF